MELARPDSSEEEEHEAAHYVEAIVDARYEKCVLALILPVPTSHSPLVSQAS